MTTEEQRLAYERIKRRSREYYYSKMAKKGKKVKPYKTYQELPKTGIEQRKSKWDAPIRAGL